MNAELSIRELILQIDHLAGKTILYPSKKSSLQIVRVDKPEGGIVIKRRNITSKTPWNMIKEENISSNMIWRYVNALNTRIPVNIDRVLGASYNTRAALEAIIASCPHFFMCRPKRITSIASKDIVYDNSHKYLIWQPNKIGHAIGEFCWADDINGFVTEIPSTDVYFDAQTVDVDEIKHNNPMLPEVKRIHSQMQVLLSETARWMELRSWVSIEDHGIQTRGKKLILNPYMVQDLSTEKVINNYPEAIRVARHIDCIWFNGGMPFVFEVEHTTGVTSGLSRMQKLRLAASHTKTDYVVVAPDEDRQLVLQKSEGDQFSDLDLWYMPYSNLTEMYAFTQKHNFRCHRQRTDFAKMFMEPIN